MKLLRCMQVMRNFQDSESQPTQIAVAIKIEMQRSKTIRQQQKMDLSHSMCVKLQPLLSDMYDEQMQVTLSITVKTQKRLLLRVLIQHHDEQFKISM